MLYSESLVGLELLKVIPYLSYITILITHISNGFQTKAAHYMNN